MNVQTEGTKMAAKKKTTAAADKIPVNVRLDAAQVQWLATYAESLRERMSGFEVTQSDVIRHVIAEAMKADEATRKGRRS